MGHVPNGTHVRRKHHSLAPTGECVENMFLAVLVVPRAIILPLFELFLTT